MRAPTATTSASRGDRAQRSLGVLGATGLCYDDSVLWLLVALTALAALCDGLTTWWGLSRHPERIVETNPLVMPIYRRVPPPVFVGLICLLDAAVSLAIGLVSRRFGLGSFGQVIFLAGIALAALNNASHLGRLRRWSG